MTGCSDKPNLKGVDLKNACQLLTHNKNWVSSLKQAKEKWGIPPSYALAIIYYESTFDPNTNPHGSSAYGYAQVIDTTWRNYEIATKHHAKRTNFDDSVLFLGWYFNHIKDQFDLNWNNPRRLYMSYITDEGAYIRYMSGNTKQQSQPNWTIARNEAQNVADLSELYHEQLNNCPIYQPN